MDNILEEFEASLLAGEWVSQGGVDFARQALERAVGPRKAQEILDRISSQVSSSFYMLRNVPADQIRTVRAYVMAPSNTTSREFTFRLTSLDEQRETDAVETRFDAPAGGR